VKLIKAIVHIDMIDELRQKLFELGAPGVTLDNVTGIGKPLGHLRYSEDKGFTPKFSGNTRIELVVEDDRVDEICDAIVAVCRTGNVGDGKIFILPVEGVIRIRTGEKDKEALY
jgi:nitrogen regulatory protein P-II 1